MDFVLYLEFKCTINHYKMYLQTAMELMGIVGIIVNCALIGQSGQVHRMFPNITSTQTIILVVILEVSYDLNI